MDFEKNDLENNQLFIFSHLLPSAIRIVTFIELLTLLALLGNLIHILRLPLKMYPSALKPVEAAGKKNEEIVNALYLWYFYKLNHRRGLS